MSFFEISFAALLVAAQLVYLAVMSALGVRLMLLAKRSRQLPEALLASHFLLCCGLGYVLLIAGLSGARDPALMPAPAVVTLIAVGYMASATGVFAEAGFNYLVFRRGHAWARGLVALFGSAMAIGYAGFGLTGGFRSGAFAGPWLWLLYGTFIAVAAWVMVEPLLYHHSMRKRLRLGLAEPLVVNRFWLWGIGSVFRFAMVTGGIIPSAILESQTTELRPDAIGWTLMGVALTGVGVAVSYWLTFFPTKSYVRFVEGRGASASGALRIDLSEPR